MVSQGKRRSRTDVGTFAAWLQAQLELRGLVQVKESAAALGVDDSTLSRWLAGQRVPQRPGVLALARGLRMPADEVQAAADADPRNARESPQALADQLDDLRRMVEALVVRLAAGPLEPAYGGVPPTETTVQPGALRPRARGRMKPVVVHDQQVLGAVRPDADVVVWIVDTTDAQPGDWVRVGTADPPVVKPYEEGDDVTGVVNHLQTAVNG